MAATTGRLHGDAVRLTEGIASWWLYIGHFIRSPFYCYAYASAAELLVLALFRGSTRKKAPAWCPNTSNCSPQAGPTPPDRLLAKLGVNVTDPSFWELGMGLLDDMVTQAESLANRIKI